MIHTTWSTLVLFAPLLAAGCGEKEVRKHTSTELVWSPTDTGADEVNEDQGPRVLEVGNDREFLSLADALQAAQDGDTIKVFESRDEETVTFPSTLREVRIEGQGRLNPIGDADDPVMLALSRNLERLVLTNIAIRDLDMSQGGIDSTLVLNTVDSKQGLELYLNGKDGSANLFNLSFSEAPSHLIHMTAGPGWSVSVEKITQSIINSTTANLFSFEFDNNSMGNEPPYLSLTDIELPGLHLANSVFLIDSGTEVEVNDSEFSNGIVGRNGGKTHCAVFEVRGQLTLIDSVVDNVRCEDNNQPDVTGALALIEGGRFEIDDSEITATVGGGGVHTIRVDSNPYTVIGTSCNITCLDGYCSVNSGNNCTL